MAAEKKPPKQPSSERLNKVSGLSDVIGPVLDPVLRKRGFASREIVANWTAIAPAIYRDVTFPDRLVWRRGAGDQAGTLYLRCAEAHRLAVSHDGALIAGAINRYFGYVLVETVKMSAEPFSPHSAATTEDRPEPSERTRREVDAQLEGIEDPELKQALERLGLGLKTRRNG